MTESLFSFKPTYMQLDEMKLRAAGLIHVWSIGLTIGILQVIACFPKGITGIRRYLPFTRPSDTKTYEVFEGDTVELICKSDNTGSGEIRGDNFHYIQIGNVRPSIPDNIGFSKNETTFVLVYHNVTRNNTDNLSCWPPNQNLNLKVLYSPSENYPLVTSNYTPQYCCDDESHGPFQFNCTTEVADPPVNVSLYIEKEGTNLPVNSADYDITRGDSFIHLSLITYLNSSFNDARLVCSIKQQLPELYRNYHKSRFIELSPRASLHIHPSNYTITKEVEIITLTCTSNVSGFALEWIDIPLDDTQYNISSVNDSIKLMIFVYGSYVNESIIVQCRGTCGGTALSKKVTLSLNNGILEEKDGTDMKSGYIYILWIFSSIILSITLSIIITFAIFVVLRSKTKRDKTPRARSANENNGNSIGSNKPTERQQLRYSAAESRNNQNGEEVVNEPIDEKEKIEEENQNLTEMDNVSQNSNSSIEMIGNPKYESYDPKIDFETNGKDDDYATVC